MALFNLAFRPFYLLAAIYAALSLPLWTFEHLGGMPLVGGYLAGVLWHAHEMVFGFAAAVITGFLFTAARNWTGLPTPTGAPLLALAALWLAGRVLVFTGPPVLAAVVDVSFLPVVAVLLWLPLQRSGNRNRFFVGILLAFAALNVAFHLSHLGWIGWPSLVMVEGALAIVVLIVTIMGGRVIPAFTANALPFARVRRYEWLDRAAIASLVLAMAAYLAALPSALVATLAFLAAALHLARLALWDPLSTRAAPILWILHVSYAWIPIGLVLLGVGALRSSGLPVFALHAFGAGAVGGMVIGMITRTARGHTGRPLQANAAEVLAYLLVHAAAVLRVFSPIVWSGSYVVSIVGSAALWSAAFAIYAVLYWPILTRARIDGKPG
jgi:uncharacterized protein involved in response to NO